jgi:hypothetical protein
MFLSTVHARVMALRIRHVARSSTSRMHMPA